MSGGVSQEPRRPGFLAALAPVVALIGLMGGAVALFGDMSAAGPAQIVLMAAGGVAALVGVLHGVRWREIEAAIAGAVGRAATASLILLTVGALIGTWMMAGTAPALIYWGLALLNPAWFYPAALIICCVVSASIGSSWTTAGTVGLALVGVSQVMGLEPAIAAGAVISGSYFGDKLSPLSDSTNLAAAVVGVDLFDHVRHLLTTTIPSVLIAAILFAFLAANSGADVAPALSIAATRATLAEAYNLGVLTFTPLILVLGLAIARFPPYPTIAIGALYGGLIACIAQPDIVRAFGGDGDFAFVRAVWTALSSGFVSDIGDADLDRLLTRGGMTSMLSIIWMVIAAMSFGAAMEKAGLLARVTEPLTARIRSDGALVASTVAAAISMNILTATQYMAIIIPGRMFAGHYARRGLAPVNLSRTVEDAGTMTSALVPWTTCGLFMSGALGVPTLEYLPYAFLNLINPLLAIGYGFAGIALVRAPEKEPVFSQSDAA